MEIYENGYVPIELKTGKMPKEGVWPGHKVQIAAYSMLIEEKFKTEVIKKIPLGRIAHVSDVATAVAFLASDAASMITGTSILIDGGWTAK